jgi:hypothetical protein
MEAVNMTKYEETALDLYLSEWPRDWDYHEVLEAVAGDMYAYVRPWIPFEDWSGTRITVAIESTRNLLETRFVARRNPKVSA